MSGVGNTIILFQVIPKLELPTIDTQDTPNVHYICLFFNQFEVLTHRGVKGAAPSYLQTIVKPFTLTQPFLTSASGQLVSPLTVTHLGKALFRSGPTVLK